MQATAEPQTLQAHPTLWSAQHRPHCTEDSWTRFLTKQIISSQEATSLSNSRVTTTSSNIPSKAMVSSLIPISTRGSISRVNISKGSHSTTIRTSLGTPKARLQTTAPPPFPMWLRVRQGLIQKIRGVPPFRAKCPGERCHTIPITLKEGCHPGGKPSSQPATTGTHPAPYAADAVGRIWST